MENSLQGGSVFINRWNLFILLFTVLFSQTVNASSSEGFNFQELKLTAWNKNVTYMSSTYYNPRGMAPLYNLTHKILNLYLDDEPIPDGYMYVSKNTIKPGQKVQSNEWGDLAKQYWGVILVVFLTALLVVLMPVIGLCFCCCRCAGACGGRSQPFDKKHDTCRRVFLGLLLICAVTGILFGVVIAFVTNSYMQEGIEESTISVRNAAKDTNKFLDTTSKQIDHLLVTNYMELSQHLEKLLKDTSSVVINDLEEKSQAVSLNYLSDFVKKLPYIQDSLKRMRIITNELRVNASQLNDGLRGVKRELLLSLTKCTADECRDVLSKYEIGKLDANGIDYNQLPDVSDIIDSVEGLNSQQIIADVSKGRDVLENIRNKINEAVDENAPSVTNAINQAGQAIKNVSHKISSALNGVSSYVNQTDKGTQIADEYIKKYGIYRFYGGLIVSTVLLVILLCLTCALFCGICGKRPDGYGDDCCNKGSGARFLLFAVAIIFLTISALAIISLAHFLIGLILHRGVCMPLKNPEGDQMFDYIDEYFDINEYIANKSGNNKIVKNTQPDNYKISEIIISCKKNNTVYNILKLYQHYNISKLKDFQSQYKIDEALQSLVDEIKIDSNITILSYEAENKIRELSQSALKSFDVDKFSDNLNDTITRYSLREIANKLKQTAGQITSQDKEMSEVRISLKNQALHLETYQDNLVEPMTNQSRELSSLASQLQRNLSYNGLPFEESIKRLLKQVREAQKYININGTQYIKDAALKLLKHFANDTETYINLVVKSVENDVGKCQPLAKVYDSIIVAVCNKIVDPFNGFWAGVGWCILIFLPTLVISIKLSSLYQKSDPYPGPLVESDQEEEEKEKKKSDKKRKKEKGKSDDKNKNEESEDSGDYMYDAYSERDNIPLANGPKSKRRKDKNRRHRSRDRRGDYYEDSGSSHGGTAGIDTRYSDMAPKVNKDKKTERDGKDTKSRKKFEELFSFIKKNEVSGETDEESDDGKQKKKRSVVFQEPPEDSRHWDGGPPRYTNPPMAPPSSEYERPPPYYYPGAPAEQE